MLPWAIKYRPKKIAEVVGNKKAIGEFVSWLNIWLKGGIPNKRAVILNGPTGTGKTALVYAAANEFNLELIELNVSDKRDAETLKNVVGSASSLDTLFSNARKRIILLDEVDGISGNEARGAISVLSKIITNTLNPIVMTANDIWAPRLRSIKDKCKVINFNRLYSSTIVAVLKKICLKEGIIADPAALKKIADSCGGDLRAAINDLQFFAQGKKSLKLSDIATVPERDREQKIFETLNILFKAPSIKVGVETISKSDVDYETLMRWVSENIPYFFKTSEEIAEAYDILAKSTIFLTRAKLTNWRLLVYFFALMASVSSVRREPVGFVKSQFPTWIKAFGTMSARRTMLLEIGNKIKARCHISRKTAVYEVLPYIAILFKANKSAAKDLAKWFDFTPEMVDVIKKL